jgi:hypothetical protein
MLCVRTYVLPQQHLRQGVANQSRAWKCYSCN